MTVKEIDKQIQELQIIRQKLERQEIADYKIEAEKNVGRCFIINGYTYVKVIGIPQEKNTMTGIIFNRYQYPALFLKKQFTEGVITPFTEGNLFSAAWGEGIDLRGRTYKEISKEEFNVEFSSKMNEFREKVWSY